MYAGTNITQDDVLAALREALANKSAWNYIDPNGDMMAEYRNDKGIRVGSDGNGGYRLQFQKGDEGDAGDYRYFQDFDASGNALGDVYEKNVENKNTYLRDLLALAAVTTGANMAFGGGGLLGSSGAEAAGGEAAGGISRLAADPFGAAAAGNTAPLATNAALGITPINAAAMTAGISSPLTMSSLASGASTAAKVADAVKGGGDILKTVLPIAGAVAGAASSKDQQQTQSSEPWKEAIPWLKDNIAEGQRLQKYYRDNPFNDIQKKYMAQKLGMLDNFTAQMPGLLGQINSMGGYKRGGGSVPSPIQFNTAGLLNPATIDFRNPFGG